MPLPLRSWMAATNTEFVRKKRRDMLESRSDIGNRNKRVVAETGAAPSSRKPRSELARNELAPKAADGNAVALASQS